MREAEVEVSQAPIRFIATSNIDGDQVRQDWKEVV